MADHTIRAMLDVVEVSSWILTGLLAGVAMQVGGTPGFGLAVIAAGSAVCAWGARRTLSVGDYRRDHG